jgi:hypothetical protein
MSPVYSEVDYSISQLGTIGMGGTSISLGHILLSLKELSGNRGNAIAGSVQRYGPDLCMVATLRGSYYERKGFKAWEVQRFLPNENLASDGHFPAMIEDLAFQIAHDTSEGKVAQTWQAFKYDMLAKEAYYRYNVTRNFSDLDTARKMVLSANNSEPYYSGSITLLSNIAEA